MFESADLNRGPKTKRVWATAIGISGQALLVGGALIAPLLSPKGMPGVSWNVVPVAPVIHTEPPKPVEETVIRAQPVRGTHVFNASAITTPTKVPTSTPQIVDAPYDIFVASDRRIGVGVPDGVIDIGNSAPVGPSMRSTATVVGVPKPPETAPAPIVRVTKVDMAEPVTRVNPVYPELAKKARISGKVELMAVLGIDGRLHEVKVISGPGLLVKAAVDAVMQWVYRPTYLNGQAVEVSAPITINFILN